MIRKKGSGGPRENSGADPILDDRQKLVVASMVMIVWQSIRDHHAIKKSFRQFEACPTATIRETPRQKRAAELEKLLSQQANELDHLYLRLEVVTPKGVMESIYDLVSKLTMRRMRLKQARFVTKDYVEDIWENRAKVYQRGIGLFDFRGISEIPCADDPGDLWGRWHNMEMATDTAIVLTALHC